MSQDIDSALERWLADGFRQIGEVAIEQKGAAYELSHFEESPDASVTTYFQPEDARTIGTYDDRENFRPLKSAPTLRHGWKLVLPDLVSLHRALDFFYPAMLGTLLSHQLGELSPVPLRDTLVRQSGMYAVAKKITDNQADQMIGTSCASEGGCLKTILWRISTERPITALPPEKFDPLATQPSTDTRTIPLLCSEACNLLIASARELVKRASAQG